MTLLREPFDKYLYAAAAMFGGLALGLASTAAVSRTGYGLGEFLLGPWSAWPRLGEADIDPYARAALARRGVAPLGRSEGLAFIAHADSTGAPLEGRCDYSISGPLPSARFWTLGLISPAGAPLENATGRYVFTSSEILRREGGGFDIVVARTARAGNWLSPGEAREFEVALRLYDAAFDAATQAEAGRFLNIVKLRCA